MAILDRPLFQRRPTKDELSQYGIPAFANGGVVNYNTAGEVRLIKQEIKIKPNGDIVRVRTVEQDTPRGTITREIEEIIEKDMTYDDDVSKNPRTPNKNKKQEEKKPEPKSDLRIAAEMQAGEEKLAKTARTSEEIAADANELKEEKRKEELAESGLNNTDSERDTLVGLEEMVKERSALYKQILGDPKEGLKQQGLLQLAQFGLNLASAKGGNFAEKIANSAKDPLTTFAALGRESLKDERAIDMLAIKGAEDELGRTQKTGSFGQLVQDIMAASPNMSMEEAYAKSIEITSQKAGKSLGEQRNEYADKLVDLYVKEEGLEVEEATTRANKKAMERFPNPTDDGETTTNTDETITDLT